MDSGPTHDISRPDRRGAFLLLFFCLLAVGAGNTMLTSAVLPPLTRELGLPDWTAGAIFSLSAAIWDRLVEGTPLGDELELKVRQGRMTLVLGAGFFVPVLDEATRGEAEATLFRNLGISADSRVDRLINRRCSRWLATEPTGAPH